MTKAQYYYGHLRERRALHIVMERLIFIFHAIFRLEFSIARLGLIQPACVIQTMSEEELEGCCLKLFPHQRIYKRFHRQTGKNFLLITRLRKGSDK